LNNIASSIKFAGVEKVTQVQVVAVEVYRGYACDVTSLSKQEVMQKCLLSGKKINKKSKKKKELYKRLKSEKSYKKYHFSEKVEKSKKQSKKSKSINICIKLNMMFEQNQVVAVEVYRFFVVFSCSFFF